MATNFKALADVINMQMLTRHNILMYEAEGVASWPAVPAAGALKVRMSSEELKKLAGLERMRKQYAKGKGGFFPRLINELNHHYTHLHAYEDKDGCLIVIFFPEIPLENQYGWTDLKTKNRADMKANREVIEGGDEDAYDYRYLSVITNFKFREWDY